MLTQDAALVAMRSEVVAEITKLRNQELEQAQGELRQQLHQQVDITTHELLHNAKLCHKVQCLRLLGDSAVTVNCLTCGCLQHDGAHP